MTRPALVSPNTHFARKCTICNSVFMAPVTTGRPTAFCSDECRATAKRTPKGFRFCIICDTEYQVGTPGTCPPFYCSRDCQDVKTICRICAQRTERQYLACSKEHYSQLFPGPFTCMTCKQPFKTNTLDKDKRFCSYACRIQAMNTPNRQLMSRKTQATRDYLNALRPFLKGSQPTPPVHPSGRPYRDIQSALLPQIADITNPRLKMTLEWWEEVFRDPPYPKDQAKQAMALAYIGMQPMPSDSPVKFFTLNYVWPWLCGRMPPETFRYVTTIVEIYNSQLKRSIRISAQRLNDLVIEAHGLHNEATWKSSPKVHRYNKNWLRKWLGVFTDYSEKSPDRQVVSELQRECRNYLEALTNWPALGEWAEGLETELQHELMKMLWEHEDMANDFFTFGPYSDIFKPQPVDPLDRTNMMRRISLGEFNRAPVSEESMVDTFFVKPGWGADDDEAIKRARLAARVTTDTREEDHGPREGS